MEAQKKPITTWSADKLGIQSSQMNRAKLTDLFMPQKEARSELIEGGTEEELGENLASKLRETGLI